jgi:hypothetical protein
MAGFIGTKLSDRACSNIYTVTLILAVVSVGLANYMVLMRIAGLWRHSRIISLTLIGSFFVCYSAVFTLMVMTIVRVLREFLLLCSHMHWELTDSLSQLLCHGIPSWACVFLA